jgi:glucose/arabinose dehydrogenase
MKQLTLATMLGLLLAMSAAATEISVRPIVTGINNPWGMVWLPDGDMLITAKTGKILRVRDGKIAAELSGVPDVSVNGQGGLMDIELHPDFADNQILYLSYATDIEMSGEAGEKGSNTAIMRARLDGDTLTDARVLYKATPNSRRGQHYGSRLEFGGDGHLYFSIGDRGQRDVNPQDPTRDGGKIYRITADGDIPTDNPFAAHAQNKRAIYSFGHRNPQGMARHPQTGKIWVHEHGPRGGDELNLINAGANYGWPILSYGINYSGTKFAKGTEREGFESPIWYWVPSIAPSGMTFVTSEKFPEWQGHLLVGSLKFNYLVLVAMDGDKATGAQIVAEKIGRARNVRQGPDGMIYVSVEGVGIKRITPSK